MCIRDRADVHESIDELVHYREHFIRLAA